MQSVNYYVKGGYRKGFRKVIFFSAYLPIVVNLATDVQAIMINNPPISLLKKQNIKIQNFLPFLLV